jgi:hypothetical protein
VQQNLPNSRTNTRRPRICYLRCGYAFFMQPLQQHARLRCFTGAIDSFETNEHEVPFV